MKFYKAIENLRQKFASGNEIPGGSPVTRAEITREEFEAIQEFMRQSVYQHRPEDFSDDDTNVGC